MPFKSVDGKIGNMRKSVNWSVSPVSNNPDHLITIQCEKRIARVDMTTKKVILSSGKGGHQGFHMLQEIAGAKEYDCPQDILEQLEKIDNPNAPVSLFG